jgi:hypothetical protein
MAQPQVAPITCSQCNAVYDSEHELRDHLRTAHRQIGSEESLPPSSVQADRTEQKTEIMGFLERTSTEGHEECTEPGEENEVGGEA